MPSDSIDHYVLERAAPNDPQFNSPNKTVLNPSNPHTDGPPAPPIGSWYRVTGTTVGGKTVPGSPVQLALESPGTLGNLNIFPSGHICDVLGVAVDPAGNRYVVGDYHTSIDLGDGSVVSTGGYDGFIAKFSPTGALLWKQLLQSAGDNSARGVAIDGQGNVIATGNFVATVDFGGINLTSVDDLFGHRWADIFVAKYSSSGVLQWAKRFGGTQPDLGDAVAVDANDNIFVCARLNSANADFGSFTLSSGGNVDVALAKLNSSGTVLWAKRIGGLDIDWAHGLAVDRGSGDVLVTGEFWGATDFGGGVRTNSGAADIFVAKYSGADGSYRWDRTIGSGGMDQGYGVAVDARTGNVIITGASGGSLDFGGGPISGGIFLAAYSSSGNYLWAQGYGASSVNDGGLSVAIDAAGTLVMVGEAYAGAVNFGGQWLIGNGNANYVIAAFSLTGNSPPVYKWAHRAGGGMNGVSVGTTVAIDAFGQATAGGNFSLTVDFGNGPKTASPTTSSGFLASYAV